jgi:rhomboid protease GluP
MSNPFQQDPLDPDTQSSGLDQPAGPVYVEVQFPRLSPIVTYTLMGVTIFIFLLQVASQRILGEDYVALLGLKVNEWIMEGQIWRLFTPMLLHGSFLHIAFNMYALFIFGRRLETFYGHGRFLVMYILAGYTGNVLSYIFSPSPSLGASTAIFGLLGAEAVFLIQNWKVFGPAARADLQNLVILVIINLLIGIGVRFDNWGHVGGLIGGAVFAWIAGPKLSLQGDFMAVSLVDNRSPSATWLAVLVVGGLFTFLVVLSTIFQA